MRKNIALVVCCVIGGIGCGGSRSEETTAGALCAETATPIASATDATPLGFTAADILKFAKGDFATSLLWQAPDQVVLGPESGRSALSVQLAYNGGAIEFVRSQPARAEGSVGCFDHVRIGVDVTLRTDGGALNETAAGSLRATTPLFASLRQPLDPAALGGTLSISPSAGVVKQLAADLAVSPLGVTGQISSIIETTTSSSVSARPVSYGIWPASAACSTQQGDASGLPAPVDMSVGGFTGSQAVSLFDRSGLMIVWRDGSTTGLVMTPSGGGDGCVRFPTQNSAAQLPEATYPIDLSVVTDDGRLNARYAGQIAARPTAAGTLGSVENRVDLSVTPDRIAVTGFAGLGDVTQYDSLSLSLFSQVNGGSMSGEIVLNGLKKPPCVTEPQTTTGGSTPACEGTLSTVLERGSWMVSAP